MIEIKTEEIGRKGCIMWSCMIYTACHMLGLWKNIGKWSRNVACVGLKVIFNRFFIGRHEGKGPFRRPVWMWDDNIEMDFKELYKDGFWLFVFPESVEWHSHKPFNEPWVSQYSAEYVDKPSNHWHLRKYRILDVFSFMVSSLLFFIAVHFSSFTQHLN